MEYETFREELTGEMNDYLDRAMDIYMAFQARDLCPSLNSLDKACASLFLAGAFYIPNIHNIMECCGFNFHKIRKFFDLENVRLDEFLCEDSYLYDKVFKYLLNIINVNFETKEKIAPKDMFPEVLFLNLYDADICGSDIIGRLYGELDEALLIDFGPSLRMLKEIVKVKMQMQPPKRMEKVALPKVEVKKEKNTSSFGEFLTGQNLANNPAIARGEELKKMKLALLRKDKSVLLIGKEGVGKTSLVQGLAYEIDQNKAHPLLNQYKILKISANKLLSGTEYRGEFEKKVEELLEEIKQYEKIIIYFEEIHTIMGLGKAKGVNLDLPNTLKPYLASGSVRLIGDTTTEEFEEYIKPDKAFARRFKIITVEEPTKEALQEIMDGTINVLENYYHISFNFNEMAKMLIFQELLTLTEETARVYNMKKTNPDLVLDIIGDAFSYACGRCHENVDIQDILSAIANCDDIYNSRKEKTIWALQNTLAKATNDKQHKLILFPKTNR